MWGRGGEQRSDNVIAQKELYFLITGVRYFPLPVRNTISSEPESDKLFLSVRNIEILGGRTGGRTDERTHGQTGWQTNGRTDGRTHGNADGRTDGRTGGRTGGRTHGRTDGRAGGRTD